jgi:hypothetical protein
MARNRKSAYGGPAEEKEIVISLDKRVLYVLGLLVAFAVAVGGGYMATRQSPETAAQLPAQQEEAAVPQAPLEPDIPQIDEDIVRATAAAAMGITDTSKVTIVDSDAVRFVETPVANAPGSGASFPDDQAAAKARVTPRSDLERDLLENPDTTIFEYDMDPTAVAARELAYKPGDVLANLEDPNVMNPDYTAVRLETITRPQSGPVLAISDLTLRNTYDYGKIAPDARVSHVFTAKNVGDEDLKIGRVYTGCGCTATTIGDVIIPPDGFLVEVITLAPGVTVEFSVEFDAGAEARVGAMSKYVQIFTNDPTKSMFDEEDPLSHETRFRLVVEPTYELPSGGSDG